jgi:Domain of unknown function (DUF6378)
MEYNTPSVSSELTHSKYHCERCNAMFDTVLELNSHTEVEHSTKKEKLKAASASRMSTYKCYICEDAVYASREELSKHYRANHDELSPARDERLKTGAAYLGKHPDEKYREDQKRMAMDVAIPPLPKVDEASHEEEEKIMLGCILCRTECSSFEEMAVHHQEKHKKNEVALLLEDREKKYGNFADEACIVQELKEILYQQVNWKALPFDSQLSIEMIILKIVRIVNGGMPDYIDNWLDIAGYATLVKNRIEGKNCE